MGGMSGMNDPLRAGADGGQLDSEVGYGLPIDRRFVGTPRVSVRRSEYGGDYRVGYGIQVLEEGRLKRQGGIEAERRVSPVFGMLENAGGRADERVVGQARV